MSKKNTSIKSDRSRSVTDQINCGDAFSYEIMKITTASADDFQSVPLEYLQLINTAE